MRNPMRVSRAPSAKGRSETHSSSLPRSQTICFPKSRDSHPLQLDETDLPSSDKTISTRLWISVLTNVSAKHLKQNIWVQEVDEEGKMRKENHENVSPQTAWMRARICVVCLCLRASPYGARALIALAYPPTMSLVKRHGQFRIMMSSVHF